ncbi:hypothetical protein N836_28090 [Leptolyngbya sp. Heron Island J]|nr:hypothetical protein N836_28090 [Leptolyngbya sp. Heron Island J]
MITYGFKLEAVKKPQSRIVITGIMQLLQKGTPMGNSGIGIEEYNAFISCTALMMKFPYFGLRI